MKKIYYATTQGEKQRARVKRLHLRNREVIDKAKDGPCVDCGEKYPACVMDFDHVQGEKKFALGWVGTRSIATIQEEIAKCELVCANCHRLRTHERQSSPTAEAPRLERGQ